MIACVFTGATVLPMLAAIPFAGLFRDAFLGERGNNISFLLVFVIGVAITSIPVISKIFFDMGVMNTAFTNTVLTVSTFQDLCLWLMLNVATRMEAVANFSFSVFVPIYFALVGIQLEKDKTFSPRTDQFNYPDFYRHLRPGMTAWANDSVFEFEVVSADREQIVFRSKSDGVQMSEETAVGRYVPECVKLLEQMDRELLPVIHTK